MSYEEQQNYKSSCSKTNVPNLFQGKIYQVAKLVHMCDLERFKSTKSITFREFKVGHRDYSTTVIEYARLLWEVILCTNTKKKEKEKL